MKRLLLFLALLLLLPLRPVGPARAAPGGDDLDRRLQSLEDLVKKQQEEIRDLRAALEDKSERPDPLGREMDRLLGKISASGMEEPGTLRARFTDGLEFVSPDRTFDIRVGGRIMEDFGFPHADRSLERAFGSFDSRTEFRRTTFLVAGRIHGRVGFKAEYDFSSGTPHYKDVWLGLREVPVLGRIRVGNVKEPFSLEKLTSLKHTTFLERGLPTALAIDRRTGVCIDNEALDGTLFWSIAIQNDTNSVGRGTTGKNVAGRVVWLPLRDDENHHLAHLGLSLARRDPAGGEARIRTHAEIHTLPVVSDTGDFAADVSRLVGLEAAAVWGPFSAQGEYVTDFVRNGDAANPTFSGAYLYVSWFLTGENRPAHGGIFTRVRPRTNFGAGGAGAFEIALRWSHLDLDDGGLFRDREGGKVTDWTLGLNWYLNPNTRATLNGVRSRVAGVGIVYALGMRVQVEF